MNAPNGAPRPSPASAAPASAAPASAPRASAAPALAAASAAILAAAIDRAAIASVVESLRAELWLTDARLGGLAAVAVLASVALVPAFASLTRRRPASRVLAVGLAAAAAGTALSGAARRALALLAARIATGAGPAARSATAPAGAAPAPAAELPAIVAGTAFGYALGAGLSRLMGWRWALAAAAIPGLLAAIACLRARPPLAARAETLPWRGEDGVLAELRRLRADRDRLLAAVGLGATTFAAGAMAFWTIAFLERRRGVPRAVAGAELAVIVLMAGIGGTVAASRAVERLRARAADAERWVAGVAALAAAPVAIAAYAAWRPRAYLVSLVLAQILIFAAARAGAAALDAEAPRAGGERAAAAVAMAIALLAEAPAPWIVGLLSDRTSLGRALAIVVPLALSAGGGAWLLAAWRARRAARGPSRPRA